jgi:glycosyltransferase involved in cell wall biosynthesis
MKREQISVILITQNQERNIKDCLQSVSWADEIIVVDGGSEDNTIKIAGEFTKKIYANPWPGFAAQKRFALAKVTMPWVLNIDSDERVTPALRDEILALLARQDISCEGYYIPRLSTFLGKFIYNSGWYPGYQLRLFRRERTGVIEKAVHEGFLVQGEIGYLKNHFLHYTHETLAESFARLNRYSSLEAEDRTQHNKVRWWDFVSHPLSAFFNKFVALKGYRDGMRGFLLAVVTAMVKMALYMKIWELQNAEKTVEKTPKSHHEESSTK